MDKPYVLIVEDDRDTAALFRHVMDLAGYRTEIAENGNAALEHLSICKPDILLLDLILPGKSGAEILQIMSSDKNLKGIHVVVITGYSQIAGGLPIEPDLILSKPVSPDQLTDFALRLCKNDEKLEAIPFKDTPWDDINGIYNRPFFMNRLNFALTNHKQNEKNPFAVILVSPGKDNRSNNKSLMKNNSFILGEIANAIQATVRPTDTVARFEQDGFFLLIENIPNRSIPIQIANRIQRSLAKNLIKSEISSPISASIGIVYYDHGYKNVDEILRDARKANSLAQADGEGFFKVFERDSG
jgi:two-component system phosphate regulon response regulator PhoB